MSHTILINHPAESIDCIKTTNALIETPKKQMLLFKNKLKMMNPLNRFNDFNTIKITLEEFGCKKNNEL